MIKRKYWIVSCIIVCLLAFTLIGCKSKKQEQMKDVSAETPTVTASPAKDTTDASDDTGIRDNLTALEVSKLMGNGINLGNTMEACNRPDLGITAEVSTYETYWGMPVTTQEIVDNMKAAGFDTLRIPVAWAENTMDYTNGDYTIRKDYLDRVEEIVNYALNNDMYVVVNDHWDGGWWAMFGSAKQETRDEAMKLYTAMWTQIAERFKNYSDYLILESANEELGDALNNSDHWSDSGTLSEDERYQTVHKINQAFVDTVRGTGGNNAQRFLLIAGYNTGIENTCDDRYIMPTDTAKNKLLVSVHYYNPWGYCGTSSLPSWGSAIEYQSMNDKMALMKKFTDQGYGVVFGEYMVARNEDGSVKDNTTDFLNNFLNNCDMYGYVPLLWDTSFRVNDFYNDDVKQLFKDRSYTAQSSLTDEEIVANAKTAIEAATAAASTGENASIVADAQSADKSFAWIMYNSGDQATAYSIGDIYDPTSKTEGIVATDMEVTGAGTYTVSLDFTGTGAGFANSVVFSAVGISNGELLYPGYIINITDIVINGESYLYSGKPYTTADDDICTRTNLYNMWVAEVPEDARIIDADLSEASPTILDPDTLGEVKTISVTFDYGPANE